MSNIGAVIDMSINQESMTVAYVDEYICEEFGLPAGEGLNYHQAAEYAFELGTRAINAFNLAIEYDKSQDNDDRDLADGLWRDGLALRTSAINLLAPTVPSLISEVEEYLQNVSQV